MQARESGGALRCEASACWLVGPPEGRTHESGAETRREGTDYGCRHGNLGRGIVGLGGRELCEVVRDDWSRCVTSIRVNASNFRSECERPNPAQRNAYYILCSAPAEQ